MDLSQELRDLYKKGQGRRELFDVWATYTKRISETPADRAMGLTGMSYDAVITLFKELDGLGIGTFKLGRKGGKTRIVWNYAPRTVGEAAKGVSNQLEAYFDEQSAEPPSEESERPSEAPEKPAEALAVHDSHALIAQAKKDLAAKLRVLPEQITITVNITG
jgi:hypothetical protein